MKKDLEGEVKINGESYLEFVIFQKRTEYQTASSVVGAITTKGIRRSCVVQMGPDNNIYKIVSDLNHLRQREDLLQSLVG